jgi:MoaA/NifB/PqqE/SkfB family radical SAM enzyme
VPKSNEPGSGKGLSLISRQTAPKVVYFGLFDNCNVKCNMCACWQAPRSSLGIDHYYGVLDAVLSLEPGAIRFTGGEPLLLRGLPGLVERAARAGVRVSVISNGRLLRGKAGALAAAGCSEIVLSIDGLGQTHDDIRGSTRLYQRCLGGLRAINDTPMTYGVNTVVQRKGIDDVSALGEMLLSQPRAPGWWHLIPVRDHPDLRPTPDQIVVFQHALASIEQRLAARGVRVVGSPAMFGDDRAAPCEVPRFAAYVRADTGDVFGCNMLAYAGGKIGNLLTEPARSVWESLAAQELRARCTDGTNAACGRCDASSRAMNYALRRLADQHQNDDPLL